MPPRLLRTMAALPLLAALGPAQAAVTGYTTQASFAAAAAAVGQVQTVDFESVAAGTTFAAGSGTGGLLFTNFSASIGSELMRVGNQFTTSSGTRYLGLNNGNDAFYAGDAFTLQFNRAVTAAGLYVITGPGVLAGDFTLSIDNNRVVMNVAAPDRQFSDGSTAYFLGLRESDPGLAFSSLRLTSLAGPLVVFNVDDITTAVPEPAAWLLLLLGLGPLLRRARRPAPSSPPRTRSARGWAAAPGDPRPLPLPAAAAAALLAALLTVLPQTARAQADDAYVGQIMCATFGFAPRGWARLDGQLLPINQNQALFALLGTTYGGNGTTQFALPNMQSRTLKHQGPAHVLGQVGGAASTALSVSQLPPHTHTVTPPATTAAGTAASPQGAVPARHGLTRAATLYGAAPGTVPMAALTSSATGNAAAQLPTEPPYVTLNCFIALQGIFPSPN